MTTVLEQRMHSRVVWPLLPYSLYSVAASKPR